MTDQRWTPRHGMGPGRIRLNDSSLLMLRQISRVALTPVAARSLEDRVTRLHRAVAGEGGDPLEEARALKVSLDDIVGELAKRRFTAADLRAMLAGLVDDGLQGEYRDYAGAEQATMAIGTLLEFLARRGEVKDVRAANAALEALHASVRDDEKYQPARFRESLARLRENVIR